MANCGTLGFGAASLPITVPVLNASINALLAYYEYSTYSDHRSNLDVLTDRNMALADIVENANESIESRRDLIRTKIHVDLDCEPCCDELPRAKFRQMPSSLRDYKSVSEGIHYSQIGVRGSMVLEMSRSVSNATMQGANEIHQQMLACERKKESQLDIQVTTGFRGELPSPNILAHSAEVTGENLNDSSILLSQFINEAMQSVGVSRALSRRTTTAVNFPVGYNDRNVTSLYDGARGQTPAPVMTPPRSIYGDKKNGSS